VKPSALDKGVSLMKGYMHRLSRSIRAQIAYVAVPESRPSGLGHHQIRLHWHFLIACPQHRARAALRDPSLGAAQIAGEPPVVALGFEDDGHAVMDWRYVELKLKWLRDIRK
jgi:hypothetical protein